MSLVEFAAWTHSLQNKVVLAVYDEWHDMNISVSNEMHRSFLYELGRRV